MEVGHALHVPSVALRCLVRLRIRPQLFSAITFESKSCRTSHSAVLPPLPGHDGNLPSNLVLLERLVSLTENSATTVPSDYGTMGHDAGHVRDVKRVKLDIPSISSLRPASLCSCTF